MDRRRQSVTTAQRGGRRPRPQATPPHLTHVRRTEKRQPSLQPGRHETADNTATPGRYPQMHTRRALPVPAAVSNTAPPVAETLGETEGGVRFGRSETTYHRSTKRFNYSPSAGPPYAEAHGRPPPRQAPSILPSNGTRTSARRPQASLQGQNSYSVSISAGKAPEILVIFEIYDSNPDTYEGGRCEAATARFVTRKSWVVLRSQRSREQITARIESLPGLAASLTLQRKFGRSLKAPAELVRKTLVEREEPKARASIFSGLRKAQSVTYKWKGSNVIPRQAQGA